MSRILTSGVVASRRRDSDPLAGYSFDLRLQSHLRDNVPFGINGTDGGATQDWTGIVGAASQPISTKRFATRYENGTPCLEADGIDDWMSIGNFGGQVTYTALIKSNTPAWNSYYSICDHVSGADTDRWGLFENGANTWHTNTWFPVAVRYNGVAASSSPSLYPCPDPSAWNVISVKTYASPSTPIERGIFQMGQSYFGNARIIALAIHTGNPAINSNQVIATENYFEDLKPSP